MSIYETHRRLASEFRNLSRKSVHDGRKRLVTSIIFFLLGGVLFIGGLAAPRTGNELPEMIVAAIAGVLVSTAVGLLTDYFNCKSAAQDYNNRAASEDALAKSAATHRKF